MATNPLSTLQKQFACARLFFSTDLALILLMIAGLGLAFLLGIKDPAAGRSCCR
jgi:hypothetical protein